jgi:chemotaxis protein CheZ
MTGGKELLANSAGADGELFEELKQRALVLMERLEHGDFPGATAAIQQMNEVRDRSIYREVGKLTRGLHEAIVNFEIDTSKVGIDSDRASKMGNARERLDYVINLTQKSADKTMDIVEQGMPMVEELREQARALQGDWQRLQRREMNAGEFRDLYRRIDQFLTFAASGASELGSKFNEILLAQDFQDLSGQVIKRVIALVQEVEDRLVELMRMAGQVEELTGIFRLQETEPARAPQRADVVPEGPQIKAAERADVVQGQDEVDDLLSSLGF